MEIPEFAFVSTVTCILINACLIPFHSWGPVADPQSLLEEKEALVEKLAISEYELRLAQEDVLKFKTELQKKTALNESSGMLLFCFTSNSRAYIISRFLCDISFSGFNVRHSFNLPLFVLKE